jgi:aryl-alcohol dehydrogenase-like predicted oxidoreductase
MGEEMTYGHLGRSGLMVSRIGLGTMNFGYTVDEPTSFAVMDAAMDAGISFFDTADVYGGPQTPDMKKGYGIAEETVGRWLQRSRHRDDIVVAAKVYQPMGLGPNDRRLSAYHIRRACEASLRRLQTDHIDLYQMQLEAYEGLCRELGAKPVDVALAWLLRNPVVSTTIVGATTTEELQSDLGALSVQLDVEVVERLDQIWPGPGEAPQAYAW